VQTGLPVGPLYKSVTSPSIPGQDPLAKVTRMELGRKRSLDDDQCFVIPLGARQEEKRSGWTMEIRQGGGISLIVDRLGALIIP
jgi:hypothetical protein